MIICGVQIQVISYKMIFNCNVFGSGSHLGGSACSDAPIVVFKNFGLDNRLVVKEVEAELTTELRIGSSHGDKGSHGSS